MQLGIPTPPRTQGPPHTRTLAPYGRTLIRLPDTAVRYRTRGRAPVHTGPGSKGNVHARVSLSAARSCRAAACACARPRAVAKCSTRAHTIYADARCPVRSKCSKRCTVCPYRVSSACVCGRFFFLRYFVSAGVCLLTFDALTKPHKFST